MDIYIYIWVIVLVHLRNEPKIQIENRITEDIIKKIELNPQFTFLKIGPNRL